MSSTSLKVAPTRSFQLRAQTRLFWKEFRQTLPLIWVFSALLFALIAIQFKLSSLKDPGLPDALIHWYMTSWGVLCMFALTVGVFLFSQEKEDNTISVLRQLPVSSGFVVRTKFLIGAAALISFILVAALTQAYQVFVHKVPIDFSTGIFYGCEPLHRAAIIGTGIILPIECFLCGVLCALSIKRGSVALLAAISLVAILWLTPIPFVVFADWFFWRSTPKTSIWSFAVIKLILLGGISCLLFPLGRHWLGNAPQVGVGFGIPTPISSTPKQSVSAVSAQRSLVSQFATQTPENRITIFRSLAWQTYRQQRYIFIPLVLLTLATSVVLFGALQSAFRHGTHPMTHLAVVSNTGTWLGLFCLIIGHFSFAADNRDENYRFFQQHGNFPGRIWFARLFPAMLLTLFSMFVVGSAYLYISFSVGSFWPNHFSNHAIASRAVAGSLIILSGFAIGQYNSIFFKSIVFLVASNLLLVVALATWGMFVNIATKQYGAAGWAYFVPIPIGMIMLTRFWAPHWITGYNKTTRVLIPHAILALVTILLVGLFLLQFRQELWAPVLHMPSQ